MVTQPSEMKDSTEYTPITLKSGERAQWSCGHWLTAGTFGVRLDSDISLKKCGLCAEILRAAAPDLLAALEGISVIYTTEDGWWLELRSQDGTSGAFPLSPNMGPIARSAIQQWKDERDAAIKKARGQS